MRKFIITAELRAIEKQVALGEISYSRMVEILNEKAEKWHKSRIRKENEECDHYFPMSSKGKLYPCEFCNETKKV